LNGRQAVYYLTLFSVPFLAVSPWQKIFGLPVGIIYGVLTFVLLMVYNREFIATLKDFRAEGISLGPLLIFISISIGSFLIILLSGEAMREHYIRAVYLVFSGVVLWLNAIIPCDKEMLEKAIKVYLTAGVLAAGYGIFVTVGYMLGFSTGQEILWTVPRLYGTATEPQVFGNFLLSVLPLTAFILILGAERFSIKGLVFALWLFSLTLIMTFSAGAWAGAVIGILLLLLTFKRIKLKPFLFSLGTVLALLVTIVFINQWIYLGYVKGFSSITVKFSQKAPGKNLSEHDIKLNMDSVIDRKWFREAAWQMFKTHPLAGVGYGNYGYRYNEYRPESAPFINAYVRAHNQYLEILAETGVLGFGAFLVLTGHLLFLVGKVLRYSHDTSLKILALGLAASLAAIGVHGYSFGIFLHNYVWVLFGLTYAACRLGLAASGRGTR